MNSQHALGWKESSRSSALLVSPLSLLCLQVGGFNGFRRLHSAEAYSPEGDSWQLVANMLCPRSNFGIEVVEDRLFVVGGFNGFTTTFNAEYYDKATNEWYSIHDMGTHRSALSCTVVKGLPNVRDYVVR